MVKYALHGGVVEMECSERSENQRQFQSWERNAFANSLYFKSLL